MVTSCHQIGRQSISSYLVAFAKTFQHAYMSCVCLLILTMASYLYREVTVLR